MFPAVRTKNDNFFSRDEKTARPVHVILEVFKTSPAQFPSQMIEPRKTPKPYSDRDGLSISRQVPLQSEKFWES